MSRHRNVRNLVEDDYYDYDDDDYYDDYDDYPAAPPPKQQTTNKKVTPTAANKPKSTPAATTTTTSVSNSNKNKSPTKGGKAAGTTSTGALPATTTTRSTGSKEQQQQQGTMTKAGSKVAVSSLQVPLSMPTSSVPTSPPPGFKNAAVSINNNNNSSGSSNNNHSVLSTTTIKSSTSSSKGMIQNDSTKIPDYFRQLQQKQQQQQQQQQRTKEERNGTSTSSNSTANDSNNMMINKPSLNVVVIGHVDAGKSTLTGRLLHYHNSLNNNSTFSSSSTTSNTGSTGQQLQQNKKQSKQQQQQQIITDYSWLLDEDIQERERGITMDIGTKFFQTLDNVPYNVTIIDSPGHVDYVPAMIVGTATADVAIVVVDCSSSSNTIQQQLYNGQLREHLLIARGLDIKQLLIVFNKMDIVVWNEQYYNEIKSFLLYYITSSYYKINFNLQKIKCIPVSGSNGINVINKLGDTNNNNNNPTIQQSREWIDKELTLLQGLYTFDPPPIVRMKLIEKSFRMILTDIDIYDTQQQQQIQIQSSSTNSTTTNTNNIYTGIAIRGKIIQGWIEINEKLLLLPSNDTTCIQCILNVNTSIISSGKQQQSVQQQSLQQNTTRYIGSGEFIECIIDDSNFTDTSKRLLSNGMILCRPLPETSRPILSNHFSARILLIDPIGPTSSSVDINSTTNNTNNNTFSTIPIIRGTTCIFHMHYIDSPCYFSKLLYTFKQIPTAVQQSQKQSKNNSSDATKSNNNNTNILIERKNPRALTFSSSSTTTTANNANANTTFTANNTNGTSTTTKSTPTWAMVEIILNSNNLICLESYNDCRPLGRFILRRNGISIAIGRIEHVLEPVPI